MTVTLSVMQHLAPSDISALRKSLEEERARLRDALGVVDPGDAAGSDEPEDVQDAAARELQRAELSRQVGREQRRLDEVEAALGRMASGVYGICEDSGDEIPVGRLRLDPTVRYTVEVQEQLEEDEASGGEGPDAY